MSGSLTLFSDPPDAPPEAGSSSTNGRAAAVPVLRSQLRIVRDLLAILPERATGTAAGELKTEYVRMPIEHWNRTDPSEAIRSDRVLPELRKRFRVIEEIGYGGTILHLLFEHIVQNLDVADEHSMTILHLLGRFEDILIRERVLPNDFVFLVARRGRGLLR
jgi:hypothetical protein